MEETTKEWEILNTLKKTKKQKRTKLSDKQQKPKPIIKSY